MSLRHSQNYLYDPALVQRLFATTGLGSKDRVLEVGPGRGILTITLAERCREVIAIEADQVQAKDLRQRFASRPNVRVIFGDALKTPLPRGGYHVFANPPFNRSAELLRRLLDSPEPTLGGGLVLQRETAEKHFGFKRASLVSMLRRPWYEARVGHRFRRRDFRPAPAVDCVFVCFRRRATPPATLSTAGIDTFRDLVTQGFTAAKGNVQQNLAGVLSKREFRRLAAELGFDLTAGPTQLSWQQWCGLHADFVSRIDPARRRRIAGAYRRWSASRIHPGLPRHSATSDRHASRRDARSRRRRSK